jgi:hypothetical protein
MKKIRRMLSPFASTLVRSRGTGGLALFILCGLLLAHSCYGTPGGWDFTNSLPSPRENHTATLLPSGKVLVAAGGSDEDSSSVTAELYDPSTRLWSFTGSLTDSRVSHTATLLLNGKVLVAGGFDASGGRGTVATCELYDPATGTWTGTGSLNEGRYDHTATLLPSGKVLVAAGVSEGAYIASAELYDPATGNWSTTASLPAERAFHTATLLPNGKVLVAGGFNGIDVFASAELYDPATGNWSSTGSLNTARGAHTATLLQNGTVLAAAGANSSSFLSSAELYNPTTGLWTSTGSLSTARDWHTATLLPNGQVLAAGGVSVNLVFISELYDPATDTWSNTGSLNQARYLHTATLLPDGTVLAAGGQGPSTIFGLATCEIFGSPDTLPNNVRGRGAFDNAGNSVTFQFQATQSDDDILGNFSFCDEAAGYCTNRGRVTSLSFSRNNATMGGYVKLDGRPVTFTVKMTDGPDAIAITLANGYSASGTLTGGKIQIR